MRRVGTTQPFYPECACVVGTTQPFYPDRDNERRARKRIDGIDLIHGIRFVFISMGESPFHISEK
eukprot:COSAG02_NODE_44819_length_362_cov_1.566540_1_plen_65_part_00